MDVKSDDSAGSDSLDKSLQKKCVVDDVGQGEINPSTSQHQCSENAGKKKMESEPGDRHSENSISTKKQKTEKNVGDGEGVAMTENATQITRVEAQQTETIADNDTQGPSHSSACSTSTKNAFETKVKQISKNLKETTLAESANKKAALEDSTSSSSSSSECEQAAAAGSTSQTLELDSSLLGANESLDDQDHRSKKVRFHPDVKENDGGNRVIPKKKKKLKGSTGSGARTLGGVDDEMDLDEEEDIEEEEEFDLAKTIAEAQDYLKLHPLTFVRPHDKSGERLQNGLLEEEDLPQLSESSEEEDFYDQVPPENGVARILGKQIKCGKAEFLLRYADRSGLYWEDEDFIWKQCPNLLNKYEQNRERRQELLMRQIAKRQNIRQRYTDF